MKYSDKYFALDKDLGRPLTPGTEAYATHNSTGRPVVELTAEQRYAFDLRGWLLIEGVLSEDEIAAAKEHIYKVHHEPDSLLAHHRSSMGGPCVELIDHPVIVGFMNEFVYQPFTDGVKTPPLGNQWSYGFRMEMSFSQYRARGDGKFLPHNGNGMMRVPGDHHTYHAFPGQAHSCLTRALWELNPVARGQGGTLFVSGSHKAAFVGPESLRSMDSPFWQDYDCPAGSVLFFTEAVTHSSSVWDMDHPRVAIFNSYNAIGGKWHNWDPHPELLAEMPPMRQTMFRPVYVGGNVVKHDDA